MNIKKLMDLSDNILSQSSVDLPTDPPANISANFIESEELLDLVKNAVQENTHGAYFDTSKLRYLHYFAIAKTFLPTPSKILDVGSAPGHVSIGLHLLGHDVTGLNLNKNWRTTYPNEKWIEKLNVTECDIETQLLPFEDGAFNVIFFTEILEHIAVTRPSEVFKELGRVLAPGGLIVGSTPNICNISNVYSLLTGGNVFWKPEIFYGSLDRHNREYTPQEVKNLLTQSGLKIRAFYGMNCHSNWQSGTEELIHNYLRQRGDKHPMLLNTIVFIGETDYCS